MILQLHQQKLKLSPRKQAMNSNDAKNKILKQIEAVRQRRLTFVNTSSDVSRNYHHSVLPDVISCFKQELEAISGICEICNNIDDAIDKLNTILENKGIEKLFCRDEQISVLLDKKAIHYSSKQDDFEGMQAGISFCELMIARTGSIVASSASPSGRQMNVFPPIHFIIAHTSQLVEYPDDAYKALQLKYGLEIPSCISTITGPSRTADIEKTLVLGAHGPKELIVLLCMA